MSGAPEHAEARLKALGARIGHEFRDLALLREALTHASAAGDNKAVRTYERLEFLGDRVLGLIVSDWLCSHYPKEPEGALAVRYNALVNRQACARAARRAHLEEVILVSKSEREGGAGVREVILADVCEAVIGALYREVGMEAAKAFIVTFWADELREGGRPPMDPKSALQEWAAARKRHGPRYDVISREGPDHAPLFVIEGHVEGLDPVRAEGASKREAERNVAIALLKQAGADV